MTEAPCSGFLQRYVAESLAAGLPTKRTLWALTLRLVPNRCRGPHRQQPGGESGGEPAGGVGSGSRGGAAAGRRPPV